MRNSLMGLLIIFLLGTSGCMERSGTFHFSGPVEPPLSLTRDAVSEIRLTEYDVAGYPSVDQAMWTEGARAGMKAVFNEFLQVEPVFRISETGGTCTDIGGKFRSGTVTFAPDPVTHDYVQRFRVTARFVSQRGCSGRIVALEEDRFLAGTGDRFTAVVHEELPVEKNGYFLVAEEVEETGNGALQVIGSGRIVRSLGPAGHGFTSPEEPGGTLCQGELWELNREVEQGDRIFLLSTSVEALPEPGTVVRGPDCSGDYPEVVVQPAMEPEFVEPAETK